MKPQNDIAETAWRNEYSCQYLEGGSDVRLSLLVDATNKCQLSCPYCYYGPKGNKMMDENKVFKACTNVVSLFGKRVKEVNIHYMGGEPLLAWDHIMDLNEMAKNHFEKMGVIFYWSLTSNLVALDEAKTEHMLREKAGIHCSFDGPADIQNRNRSFRNGQGSYMKVIEAIPRALSITPNDTARITVRPEDAGRLPEIAQEVLERGFMTAGLFPETGVLWTKKTIDDWQIGISGAFDTVRKTYGDKKGISTIIKPITEKQKHNNSFDFCGAGKGLWAFDLDGWLFFCHHMTAHKELAIIDASSSSTEQIRRAVEKSNLPPRTSKLFDDCGECSALDFCHGGCWSNNLFITGLATLPDKSDCSLKVATAEAIGDRLPIQPEKSTKLELCGRCHYMCVTSGCDTCESCQASCQSCAYCTFMVMNK